MSNVRRYARDEQALIDTTWCSSRAFSILPIREVERPDCRDGPSFQRPEGPDVHFSELWHEVDVRRTTKRVRDCVSAMVVWTGAQGVPCHAAGIPGSRMAAPAHTPSGDQTLRLDIEQVRKACGVGLHHVSCGVKARVIVEPEV